MGRATNHYLLRVRLKARKGIWRTISLSGDRTLHDLHEAIFVAFDRYDRNQFARDIVGLCRTLSHQPGVCRQIAGQLLRAGTSVGANAEEAKGAHTRRDRILT